MRWIVCMSGRRGEEILKHEPSTSFSLLLSPREAGRMSPRDCTVGEWGESYSSKVLCSACGPWQRCMPTSAGLQHRQTTSQSKELSLARKDWLLWTSLRRQPPWASLKEVDNMKVIKYKPKQNKSLCGPGLPRIICVLSRPWEPKPELKGFWFFHNDMRTIIIET